MNLYTKIFIAAASYTAILIGGWLLGLDYAAMSCQQHSEFSSEGTRYVCMPSPFKGEAP